MSLQDTLREMRNEIGSEFVSADVVGTDGLSIANEKANPDFDSQAAAARFAMVMKLAMRVTEKLDLGDVEDNLVTTSDSFILTRFLGDGSYYLGLAVTQEATLGVVRMLIDEYADQLWEQIPR